MSAESVRAASRWATRIIPAILAASAAYATYVTVARVCVDYLINSRHEIGAAIAILTLHFLLLLLMVATYLRTIWMINTDAGLVPLGPAAVARREYKSHRGQARQEEDLESRPYYAAPDPNPDSPGLEQFYTKEVFVCENDGRPKWCSECCNWKPDRAHHSSEINRCVIRMDHYCPWVGGMIGENSFKFFTQFTMYTAFYCGVVLGAAGYGLKKQLNGGYPADSHLIAALALGGFFGLFTFSMTLTSWRYITTNMTNIDMLGAKSKVYQLAVRIPQGSEAADKYHTITYPLPKPGETVNGQVNGATTNGQAPYGGVAESPNRTHTERDTLAVRTFAILRTDPGENLWDLGTWRNWQEIMGPNVVDWVLPIRRSPCVNHDRHDSYYCTGPVMKDIRLRYGMSGISADETDRIELRNLQNNMIK
ncbi:palmitoyltransferase PFA5 [Xylariales sp. AK1849]|nr:palmitoyltransferase PFA5 [Xylariales sp. AK1849]